ncbi:alpha/beta fold hydrolase [Roseivirga sp.]|uniref:alpha/beta fold hydrolase n=1 Tax=Roseivirga sp. TaxID=1964215 RepID=UPI003B8D50D9
MLFLKAYLSILQFISPKLAAKQMFSFMSNPRISKLRDFENEILEQSDKKFIRFKDFDIQTYTWGKTSSKVAMLVHGWEGQAGNFGGLVDLLLEKGFKVVAFDAPAHGHSSKGSTNMFDFVEIIDSFIIKTNPELIISHSFGSVTAAAAIRRRSELQFKNWIMVTCPHDFRERIQDVANTLSISQPTIEQLFELIEEDTGEHIDDLNMTNYCSKIANVEKVTIVHSIHDKILPIRTSRKVHAAFEQSEMIELENLGHYKILWSNELKEIVNRIA